MPEEAITAARGKGLLIKPSPWTSHEEESWTYLELFVEDCSVEGEVYQYIILLTEN